MIYLWFFKNIKNIVILCKMRKRKERKKKERKEGKYKRSELRREIREQQTNVV